MATLVYPSTDVSIICDCPYAGKTREIKGDPDSEARKRDQIQKQLKKAREDLIVARNVLVDARSKVAMFRRLLGLELGWVVHPYAFIETTWRDRVREKAYLKSELVHLVDYLRGCDQSYRSDPSVHPTKLSCSTEDLLLHRQERALKKLYHDYAVYHSENEKRVGAALWEFLELKENYQNKLHHNKIMEREIVSLKGKIAAMQRQFLEDKCMIDYITEHHFQMRGCFLEALPKEDIQEDTKTTNTLDSEGEQFKKLWEQSRREKREMMVYVGTLKRKLESASQRIVRAENVCSRNIIELRILTRKMKENAVLSKLQPRKKEVFGKFSLIQYRSQKSQLEAAVNENSYLRNFLRKAILSKTDDMKRFQQSLLSTAEKYRVTLEGIRNNLNVTEKKEPEVLPAAKKGKKS